MRHFAHDPVLVLLSFIVACLASYAALQLSSRVVVARGWPRAAWLAWSAVTMGVGIWSMHFIAMLAVRIGIPIGYDIPLLLLSVVVAVAASAVAFYMAARPRPSPTMLLAASLFMGPAIAGMHYTGMASVRFEARIAYDAWLVALSVIIAITASRAALHLAIAFREDAPERGRWARPLSAVVMGTAVSGMHYTGMWAATFTPTPGRLPVPGRAILATDALAYVVAITAMLIVTVTLIAVALDRSVRAKTAEALEMRESEQRIRVLLEGVRDHAIFSLDPAGKISSWNAGAQRMFGYAAEEIVGRPVDLLCPAEAVARGLPDQERVEAARTGRFEDEGWRVRRDGSRFWGNIVVSSLYDADGHLSGFSKLVRDVTERRRADEALRESEERLRFALQAARMATWELDPATGILRWSGEQSDPRGMPRQLVEETFEDLLQRIHPDDRESVRASIARIRTQGLVDVDYRVVGRSGLVRWINTKGRRIGDGQRSGRIVGISIDITERRELEEQLRQSQKIEAVGQLAGGIAHDFNNLLTVIQTNVEFLREGVSPGSDDHETLQEVITASKRAASLTRQLLAFSRKQLMQPRVLDLNAVVSGLAPMLRRLIGEDIAVSLSLAPDAPAVLADPGQIEQVLVNLAVNARDAMPRGGTLTIGTAAAELSEADAEGRPGLLAGRYARLTVSDTGTGIDPAIQPRVFEPFFTTKEAGKGTGLGLSTVYGIVKQSGGYIWLDSIPGRGATFTIYLPHAQATSIELPAAPGSGTLPSGSETLLLAEDEEAVRRLGRRILERQGYRILEAVDGVQALEVAAAHEGRIHGLVTDVVMPRMGGRELAERMTAARPGIAILFLSGYTNDEILRRGLIDPNVAFLQKPFTSGALVTAVRRVLDAAGRPGQRTPASPAVVTG